MDPHVQALTDYAKSVVKGKIPAGKYVRLACKRHLDDLERSKRKDYPYQFDESAVRRFCRFAELWPHVAGKWAKRKEFIKLEPWQCFCLGVPFGWKRKKDGLRRFVEVYEEIPRKNSKSTMSAIVGNYCLTSDGEHGAQVFCGATTEDQAWKVFEPARLQLENSPDLKKELGIEVWAKSIIRTKDHSKFRPIIGNPGDGDSPSCAIIDEFHEHQTPDMYNTMITGMGSREQPLCWLITTAGDNIIGPCYDKHLEVKQVLDGVIENDRLFGIIYGIDEEDDWTRPEILKKANPNFGISVDEDFLLAQQRQAVLNTVQQAAFKTKHLNVWLQARAGLINLQQWKLAGNPRLKIEDFAGCECWFALDGASKSDLFAFTQLFKRVESGIDHWYVFGRYYLPEAAVDDPGPNQAAYRKWVIEGFLNATEGATIDYETIEEDVIELGKRFNPKEVVYDPWNMTQMSQHLAKEGMLVVDFAQTIQNLAVPTDTMLTFLKDSTLHHDANPVLAWAAANVTTRISKKSLPSPAKEKDHQKIDPIVSLIMGIARGTAIVEQKIPGIVAL